MMSGVVIQADRLTDSAWACEIRYPAQSRAGTRVFPRGVCMCGGSA
jgi:hypothetical protein